MTGMSKRPRGERQQAEPKLNLDATGSNGDSLEEPGEPPTLEEVLRGAGLLVGSASVGSLLKAGMQHVDDHGYTDGDAEWLTPLVEAAARPRAD